MLGIDLIFDSDLLYVAEEMLMHVEGWEFVSEHALAKEYVMTAGDVISSV